MSFNTNVTGVDLSSVSFDTIEIDAQQLAIAIAPFIFQGSKVHFLTRSDLNISVVKYGASSTVPANERISIANGFEGLMRAGQNKFFDVLIYMAMNPADRLPPAEIDENQVTMPVTYGNIARAMFVQYFFVLTRGRVSQATGNVLGSDMPKFLHTVLNCREAPIFYHNLIASFDMHKLGYEWVKHVPFNNIAREAFSRFGLGVAGYRMLSPFKLLTPRVGLAANIQSAYNLAHSMAVANMTWSIHPATRDNAILTQYGPLNANLGNLMLEVFEQAQLTELVTRKVIYAMPVFDPSATQYRTWTGAYTPAANTHIF